jgi:hypothetical protein
LARLDRKRKKRTSNKEWKSPFDGDARVAKMKDVQATAPRHAKVFSYVNSLRLDSILSGQ